MSSKTRIIVLRMKEIIYTAIFIGLAILLVMLSLFMFRPKKDSVSTAAEPAESRYIPGLYSASIVLGSQNVNVEVAVDRDRIHAITMVPLSDSVTTMYPLMEPALESISEQIIEKQSTEEITYSQENQYTSMVLLNAIEDALSKAQKGDVEE